MGETVNFKEGGVTYPAKVLWLSLDGSRAHLSVQSDALSPQGPPIAGQPWSPRWSAERGSGNGQWTP